MFDEKIIVTPSLERPVVSNLMTVAGVFVRLMKMHRILLEKVGRREVCTTAKPPTAFSGSLAPFKIAIVGVDGWCHRVVRVKHEAQSRRKEI